MAPTTSTRRRFSDQLSTVLSELRQGKGFSDLAQQEADSRVFGGIHYRFDNEASQAFCVKAPEFAAERFMVPCRR